MLPAGLSFVDNGNGTATIIGAPTVTGSFPLIITAGNGVFPSAQQSFTLTINQAPIITSTSGASFTVGVTQSFLVTTSPGQPPNTFLTITDTNGNPVALPLGLTFTDNGNGTGTLSGTPGLGTFGVTLLQINASNGAIATQAFARPSRTAAFISPAGAIFGAFQPNSFTIRTSGFPNASVNASGALPTGITLTDNGDGTATLSGTPSVTGTFQITLSAGNGVVPSATQTFTLSVNQTPTFTSASGTTFTVGQPGIFTITTSPGTLPTGAITEVGVLPAGISFADNGNGTATLSGTPAPGTGGPHTFQITATNGASITQIFTLTINDAPTFSSSPGAIFEVGQPGNFTSGPRARRHHRPPTPAGVLHGPANGATLGGQPSLQPARTLRLTASNVAGRWPDVR